MNNKKLHLYATMLFKNVREWKMDGICRFVIKDLTPVCQYTCQALGREPMVRQVIQALRFPFHGILPYFQGFC